MLQDYLFGAAKQDLARVQALRDVVHKSPFEMRDLKRICHDRLVTIEGELASFLNSLPALWPRDPELATRTYERLTKSIALIEGNGVFALTNASPEDAFLNRLTDRICQEITYPYLPPTVSLTSREHYYIDRDFHLLCVPPLEGQFLLHLPDLYHELCHPLLAKTNQNVAALKPLFKAFKFAIVQRWTAIDAQLQRVDRASGPEKTRRRFTTWKSSWMLHWMEELFCDLFAVFFLGPAYAWSNYHLCVKRGGAAYETPNFAGTFHPPDAARTQLLLLTLEEMGFENAATNISATWDNYTELKSEGPDMSYAQCFPNDALRQISQLARAAFIELGLRPAEPGKMTDVATCLNQAWDQFWTAPAEYVAWEEQAVLHLRTLLDR